MAQPADPPADPDRYDEAVRAFRRRVPMTDPEFRELVETERERAFWVAGVTHARVIQDVFNAIDRAIEKGTTIEEFREQVGQKVEAWGGEDSPRLEATFRTGVMQAYNDGRFEVINDPEVRKARPYLRFDTAGDSRVSDICDALDGKVLPADDPFVRRNWPPLHPNCRSVWTPLSREEAEEEGISVGTPDTKGRRPTEGFGRAPTAQNLEPDISGLDPALKKLVRGPHE